MFISLGKIRNYSFEQVRYALSLSDLVECDTPLEDTAEYVRYFASVEEPATMSFHIKLHRGEPDDPYAKRRVALILKKKKDHIKAEVYILGYKMTYKIVSFVLVFLFFATFLMIHKEFELYGVKEYCWLGVVLICWYFWKQKYTKKKLRGTEEEKDILQYVVGAYL